jgi:hypothetical protein
MAHWSWSRDIWHAEISYTHLPIMADPDINWELGDGFNTRVIAETEIYLIFESLLCNADHSGRAV